MEQDDGRERSRTIRHIQITLPVESPAGDIRHVVRDRAPTGHAGGTGRMTVRTVREEVLSAAGALLGPRWPCERGHPNSQQSRGYEHPGAPSERTNPSRSRTPSTPNRQSIDERARRRIYRVKNIRSFAARTKALPISLGLRPRNQRRRNRQPPALLNSQQPPRSAICTIRGDAAQSRTCCRPSTAWPDVRSCWLSLRRCW